MALEPINFFIIEQTLRILPRWLVRALVRPKEVARHVDIDLRRINPIDITFGTDIPRISIYFRISNMSPFNLILDRLLIELWVGQPTFRRAILERYDVPKRSSREDVYFSEQLTIPQQEQIRKHVNGQLISEPITIYVKAYFESKVGFIYVEKILEHRDVPCKGKGRAST